MNAIIKVWGVSAGAVAKLHEVLKEDDLRTKEIWSTPDKPGLYKQIPHVQLIGSKLDVEQGTYALTIAMDFEIHANKRVSDADWHVIHPPFKSLEKVLRALSPNILPKEETIVRLKT